MHKIKQTQIFARWLSRLRDKRARTIIAARLLRLSNGLPCDLKPVGHGVSELRIHYGPGYRLYFRTLPESVILLLYGGTKDTQALDIVIAKEVANHWNKENDE